MKNINSVKHAQTCIIWFRQYRLSISTSTVELPACIAQVEKSSLGMRGDVWDSGSDVRLWVRLIGSMIRDALLSRTAQRWITSRIYTLTRLLAFLDKWTKGEFIIPCSRKREWEEERDCLLLGQPPPHFFSSSPFPTSLPPSRVTGSPHRLGVMVRARFCCCGVIGWFVNVNDLPLKRINQPTGMHQQRQRDKRILSAWAFVATGSSSSSGPALRHFGGNTTSVYLLCEGHSSCLQVFVTVS